MFIIPLVIMVSICLELVVFVTADTVGKYITEKKIDVKKSVLTLLLVFVSIYLCLALFAEITGLLSALFTILMFFVYYKYLENYFSEKVIDPILEKLG